VLGRHCEAPGSLLQRLRVDVDGRPLLRNDLALGPRWPGSLGPAGTAGARAVGTVLVVGAEGVEHHADVGEARVAVVPLGDRATLVTALAPTHAELEAVLDGVCRKGQ
jgi:urease accessory protein